MTQSVLTRDQRQLLILVARGKTSRQMASLTRFTEHGIEQMIQDILRKLGASNRPHALALALTSGILSLDDLGLARPPGK